MYMLLVDECINEAPAQENNKGLASTAVFESIREQVKSNPELVKKTKAIFLWKVTQNGNTVTEWSMFFSYCLTFFSIYCFQLALDFKDAPGDVYQGAPRNGKPDCTLTMSDEDIVKMAAGELDAQKVSHHSIVNTAVLLYN